MKIEEEKSFCELCKGKDPEHHVCGKCLPFVDEFKIGEKDIKKIIKDKADETGCYKCAFDKLRFGDNSSCYGCMLLKRLEQCMSGLRRNVAKIKVEQIDLYPDHISYKVRFYILDVEMTTFILTHSKQWGEFNLMGYTMGSFKSFKRSSLTEETFKMIFYEIEEIWVNSNANK